MAENSFDFPQREIENRTVRIRSNEVIVSSKLAYRSFQVKVTEKSMSNSRWTIRKWIVRYCQHIFKNLHADAFFFRTLVYARTSSFGLRMKTKQNRITTPGCRENKKKISIGERKKMLNLYTTLESDHGRMQLTHIHGFPVRTCAIQFPPADRVFAHRKRSVLRPISRYTHRILALWKSVTKHDAAKQVTLCYRNFIKRLLKTPNRMRHFPRLNYNAFPVNAIVIGWW